ncbi:MAG: ribonuclease, partial [Bryobacteraceae bacterium]|nr:ribonuclease [Bryobacteraceae bacterium]
MGKELVVTAGRHETRVALLEDDQLVEVYFQRANEYSLAGSIHKGRVTRVLPGMQSSFVNIGLERDAFLYVTDFFEENDEFADDKPREARGGEDRDRGGDRGGDRDRGDRGGRDRDRGGRGGRDRDRDRGGDRGRRDDRPIATVGAVVPAYTMEAAPAAPPAAEAP